MTKRLSMLMTTIALCAWTLPLLAQERQPPGERERSEQTAERAEKESESLGRRAGRAAAAGVKKGVEATREGAEVAAGAARGAGRGTRDGIRDVIGEGGEAATGAAPNTLTAEEAEDGWELLFNGRDLTGFRAFRSEEAPPSWQVVDGTLAYVGRGGDLMTTRQFGSFELAFEWKISPGGNSGVMYHVTDEGEQTYWTGPEYQILDNDGHPDAKNGPDRTAGACYALYAPTVDATKPVGEWNSSRIVVHGTHVEHWLNGEKVVEYELGSDDWNRRVAASKFDDWPMFARAGRGHIVFQDHGDDVWYRSIRIRELEGS